MEGYYPLYINLRNKKILVVGAGKVAFRKINTLIKYCNCVKIITRELKDARINNFKEVDIEIRDLDIEKDLNGVFMVITATDDTAYNDFLCSKCLEMGILCNNASSKYHLDVRMPAYLEYEEFQIGISARGNVLKSKALRDDLKNILKNGRKK